MGQYWKTCPTAPSEDPTEDCGGSAQPAHESILSEFNHYRLALFSTQDEDEGWQSEMRLYLKDLPADVTKDADIVKWWQVSVTQCKHCFMI